jgi:hypothetical protein
MQVININNWLQGLSDEMHSDNLTEEAGKLIKVLTDVETKLSVAIAEIYRVARMYQLQDLVDFCAAELQGILQEFKIAKLISLNIGSER